ncbi:hypothetical protein DFA_09892 [Cavenderia fasciculata]|uniref:Uncharacterized protein n=1 Tax=Cavenderia fasciculata TaxID=261658 RepID=F4Q8Q0_CACFS|nr:uncharacterized protein DFA_09892 [Cavenderia fasciculata]EGG15069.1 hypothetical protein DFA_09892 [Cavenderia fasciculata]|eukprot:XP_004351789.1 hypothetical protein DFA_09892 [Cavenderia fasciculata]
MCQVLYVFILYINDTMDPVIIITLSCSSSWCSSSSSPSFIITYSCSSKCFNLTSTIILLKDFVEQIIVKENSNIEQNLSIPHIVPSTTTTRPNQNPVNIDQICDDKDPNDELYTFESTNSSLCIIYQFKSPSDIEYNCENETTKYQYDTSSSSTTIKSYSIDTPVGTMMASFSNRVEIDENYAMVSSILAITSVDSSTPSTNGIQYIAIQVPSFGDYVEIDPIFSATSKTAPSTDACIVSSASSSFVPPILLLSIISSSIVILLFSF